MYLGGGYVPVSIDQQKKWIDDMIDLSGNNRRFMICDIETKQAVGMIGLYEINFIHRVCEIGIYIGEKSFQGKGFAKESCELIQNYALDYLNIRKIKLCVVSENTKAVSLWISLGYEIIGEYKKERYLKGEYKDLTIMEKFL